jgi:pimeloyl-ACP methyl ester carboxylesterase
MVFVKVLIGLRACCAGYDLTPATMAIFVLVHGAWHGGWCWSRVAPLLRGAGHQVYAPTLTGLGEGADPPTPAVGLDTHVRDVLELLASQDLAEVVLVGHSYAGMVITAVADRVAERLAHLVYLDAFVPEDGQCVLDLVTPERAELFREQARTMGDGWLVPALPLEAWGVTDPTDVQWATRRILPQPLGTLEQPLRLSGGSAASLPRTYISTDHLTFQRFAERARTEHGWRTRHLATGHDAMITRPRELAALLLEIPR